MTPLVEQIPLWLSLAFTLVGIVISVRLAWLAYKGVLFAFALIMTAGIVVFGFHHLIELASPRWQSTGQGLEAVASLIFLAVAVYMGYSLRKILYDR